MTDTEPTKHPGGRPSEYDPNYCAKARDYVAVFKNPAADPEMGEVVPTIEGLAYNLGVGKQTLYRWAESHTEFRDALDELKELQGLLLQSNGLQGKFAPVITKLMLSANHGMAEKSETDHTSKGEKIAGLVVEFVKTPNASE